MNLSWLLPDIKGIPVLMYHKVWPGHADALTITPERLQEQWQLLKTEGYQALSLTEFLAVARGEQPRPAKAVLITFDDGYRNNLRYAYPLLQQTGFKATFFIIGSTLVVGAGTHENPEEQKMTVAELKEMSPDIVQLGIHGHDHKHLGAISTDEAVADLKSAISAFAPTGLEFHQVFAYPYGGRPKDMARKAAFRQKMQEIGITAAFRIGNQVSKVPAPDIFEIKRIDIRGTDTLDEFRIKLKKGKLKPF
jgi:peptidoglycan/xylan/chitin deacetylase (PgdA/CDA1 family)